MTLRLFPFLYHLFDLRPVAKIGHVRQDSMVLVEVCQGEGVQVGPACGRDDNICLLVCCTYTYIKQRCMHEKREMVDARQHLQVRARQNRWRIEER